MGQSASAEEAVRRLKDPAFAGTRCDCVTSGKPTCEWRSRNPSVRDKGVEFEWLYEHRCGGLYFKQQQGIRMSSAHPCLVAHLNATKEQLTQNPQRAVTGVSE